MRSSTDNNPELAEAASDDSGWSARDRFPPYVATDAERRRWSLCHRIAVTMSECCEPDGRVDNQFVWFMERQLWASDLPTDDEEPTPRGQTHPSERFGI